MPVAPRQPLRILVIDDDVVMSEVLFALLSMRGHTVTAVESGETAHFRGIRGPLPARDAAQPVV